MSPSGYIAYRYDGKLPNNRLLFHSADSTFSGKYYRTFVDCNAHPNECMVPFIAGIPRNDPARLEDWITKTSKSLEDEHQRGDVFSAAGNGFDDVYVRVLDASDCSWTLGEIWITWVYVIDLDHRVFTVNGALHFKLETLPQTRNVCDFLWIDERCELPAKFIKPVDLWLPPRFDTVQAQETYDRLQSLVVPLTEWGVASWESFTVSQHLSTTLVETLVDDYTDDLALHSFSSVWHKVGLFCWQAANAAASSHLTCPPFEATPKPSSLYVRASLIKYPSTTKPSITHYMGGQGSLGRYCWFRGCLVTFCPRLDEPVYMMRQVGLMVEALRKHGRTHGTGIVMSGWHVVAVDVNESEVRHSPVLDLHDGKTLKDGFLLLMHLLAPAFTVVKTPWRHDSPIHRPTIDTVLPEEVIQQIIHFTDLDTYSILPFVSKYFRSIYLAHPRVGNDILLGYEAPASSSIACKGPVFRIRSTDSTRSVVSRLARFRTCVANNVPLWRYRGKCYAFCVLQPGFAGTFYYVQPGTGPWPLEQPATGTVLVPGRGFFKNVQGHKRAFFKDVIKGNVYPEMRIQALDGLWTMVSAGIGEEKELPPPQPYLGIILSEHLFGFDKEDLEELDEVESEGWFANRLF